MAPFFEFLRHKCLEWILTFLSHPLHICQHNLSDYWAPPCLLPRSKSQSPLGWTVTSLLFSCSTVFTVQHSELCSIFSLLHTPAALASLPFAEHRRPLSTGTLAGGPSTNHTLPSYSHGLYPSLQISSSHGSLPWTTCLKLNCLRAPSFLLSCFIFLWIT